MIRSNDEIIRKTRLFIAKNPLSFERPSNQERILIFIRNMIDSKTHFPEESNEAIIKFTSNIIRQLKQYEGNIDDFLNAIGRMSVFVHHYLDCVGIIPNVEDNVERIYNNYLQIIDDISKSKISAREVLDNVIKYNEVYILKYQNCGCES